MNLDLLLDMAVSGDPDRVLVGRHGDGLTAADLQRRAANGAAVLRTTGAAHVVYIAVIDEAFPTALFAASRARVPLVPLNYRLAREQLSELISQNAPAYVIADQDLLDQLAVDPEMSTTPAGWLALTDEEQAGADDSFPGDPDDIALLLYTSGTTAAPKAAVLRHKHLTSYVLTTIEFGAADPGDCSLVSVPPYHIAGVANTITNIYAGRRVVHLSRFTPEGWIDTVRDEGVTQALVVPTMLARVVEKLDDTGAMHGPALRSIAYGGAPMPRRIIERALDLFPDTNFVNAYGLTETSSTIAVLGPEDHREAVASGDPAVRVRLDSVGRPVPGIEVEVRDDDGTALPAGRAGNLFVRGDQVSGEYRGRTTEQTDGWFATRDLAYVDDAGFLFVKGRADDTIIRGGENIAPAEIEAALEQHPAVSEVAVVGLPDEEWGQRIAAVVVLRPGRETSAGELRDFARGRLRGSKTPEVIELVTELPRTDTGKLLRRSLVTDLTRSSTTTESAKMEATP